MAAFSIQALHDELYTDPQALGYADAIASGDDNALADTLNQVRAGGGYQVDRDPVRIEDVFSLIDANDFAALTTTKLAQLQTIFTLPQIDLAVSNVRENLSAIFGSNSPTQQALVALQKRQGSRAEVLWGPGTIVTGNAVYQATHL